MSVNRMFRCLIIVLVIGMSASLVMPTFAQSGGQFAIQQSVISNGGINNSTAGQFTLSGTIGQAATGLVTGGASTSLYAGFWSPPSVMPVVTVTISGKVLTPDGNGLKNATVTMTDSHGVVRKAISSTFGFYQIDNVAVGDMYTLYVISKRYRFAVSVVQVMATLTNVDFTGVE